MRHLSLSSIVLAGVLFASGIGSSAAQTAADDPTTHHPDAALPAESQGDAPSAGMPQEMMGMMTPEMMQMMMRMMRQGMTPESMMEERGMPGMMREGMPHEAMGPGMMGRMRMGDGMKMGMPGGDPLLYGSPHLMPEEMTPERVRELLEQRLDYHGNPRLTLGEIAEAEDGSITAEILTTDGSLVQKLAFNRYPGLVRQLTE